MRRTRWSLLVFWRNCARSEALRLSALRSRKPPSQVPRVVGTIAGCCPRRRLWRNCVAWCATRRSGRCAESRRHANWPDLPAPGCTARILRTGGGCGGRRHANLCRSPDGRCSCRRHGSSQRCVAHCGRCWTGWLMMRIRRSIWCGARWRMGLRRRLRAARTVTRRVRWCMRRTLGCWMFLCGSGIRRCGSGTR